MGRKQRRWNRVWGRPFKVYIYGYNEWYCIDLESLPETDAQLSPVAKIENTLLGTGDWTVIGDCIYWIGGIIQKKYERGFRKAASTKLLRHSITTDVHKLADWEVACPFVKLPRINPRVFALDRNTIFVLGGGLYLHNNEGDDIERLSGEVYSLGTTTCDLVASHVMDFAPNCSTQSSSLVMTGRGEPKQVLFFSFDRSELLFYNVCDGTLRLQVHPEFALDPRCCPQGLVTAVMNANPVMSKLTLYWFTNDLCLYGYDIVDRKWFRSQVLETQELWELHRNSNREVPILVDLFNGEFMVVARTLSGKLGIALLGVSTPKSKPMPKPLCKFTEFFKVTVISCRTLSPSTDFTPMNAMSVLHRQFVTQHIEVQDAGAEAIYFDQEAYQIDVHEECSQSGVQDAGYVDADDGVGGLLG